jgi:hypothetical protein
VGAREILYVVAGSGGDASKDVATDEHVRLPAGVKGAKIQEGQLGILLLKIDRSELHPTRTTKTTPRRSSILLRSI